MKVKRVTPSDPQLEREGVWMEYHGVQLLIARANHPDFIASLSALREDYRRQHGRDIPDQGPDRRTVISAAMAGTVLRGWQGVQGQGEPQDDGSHEMDGPMQFTASNARELLEIDDDLFVFVGDASAAMENFIRADVEARAGN